MNAPARRGPAGGRPDPLLHVLLRSPRWRPLRFGLTGASAGLVQLGLLRWMTAAEVHPLLSHGVGFLIAAQANFQLSQAFTWADRPADGAADGALWLRWARFHLAISGTALLNMLVFAAAHAVAPDITASALGIGVAAALNFLLADRVVFRAPGGDVDAARSASRHAVVARRADHGGWSPRGDVAATAGFSSMPARGPIRGRSALHQPVG